MRYLPFLLLLLTGCKATEDFDKTVLNRAKDAGFHTKNVVVVSSYQELIEALDNNTTILVKAGKHDLSKSNVLGDGTPAIGIFNGLSEYYEDSYIHDIENLTIIGLGDSTRTSFLQPDSYNHVLKFKNVKNLYIENLVLGHSPEVGWCVGGVVYIHNGDNIELNNCHLFGSGTEGLTLITVHDLTLSESKITGCSEQLSTISHSTGITYNNCLITKNVASLRGFAVHHSEVLFKDCTINYKHPFYMDRADYAGDIYDRFFYIDGDYDIAQWHVSESEILYQRGEPSVIAFENTTCNDEVVNGLMK